MGTRLMRKKICIFFLPPGQNLFQEIFIEKCKKKCFRNEVSAFSQVGLLTVSFFVPFYIKFSPKCKCYFVYPIITSLDIKLGKFLRFFFVTCVFGKSFFEFRFNQTSRE